MLPAVGSKLGTPGPHIAALWLVFVGLTTAFVLHMLGDGTLRDQVQRTECHVEWLVERAVAEDRGLPAPQFTPLACR